MIHEGDMCGWHWNRKLYICYVRRFSGKDDDLAQLVTEKCLLSGGPARVDATAYTYHTQLIPVDWVNRYGDVIVPKAKADEIQKQILAFLQTKKGKAMVSRPPREEVTAPDAGRGTPQRADIPMKTTIGFTGNLNGAMTYRISDGGMRQWSLTQMKSENLVIHNVFVDRETHGYSFKEIAQRRDLTENNARVIFHRAKNLMRILADSYPVAMRHERRQEEAA